MNEEILTDIAQGLIKTVEAAIATDDMLALLCIHFAQSSPDSASRLLGTLQKMREAEGIDKSSSFVVLAQRLEQALSGDQDLAFLSLKKPSPIPTTPEELRARLRVIQGGRS